MSAFLELIAKKKAALQEQQAKEEKERKDSELAPFISEQSYPLPDPLLFLAAWTPFLKNPYKVDTMIRREYIRWLLSPSLYVLNIFPKCNEENLLSALLAYHPITRTIDLHLAYTLISDICLMVPKEYEEKFLWVLEE